MKVRFRFRLEPTELIIDPAEVAAYHEDFGRLRTKLIEKYNGDVAKVDTELARRLFPSIERFGAQWMARISTALDNVAVLREHLSGIREGILKGEYPRPDVIRDDFGKLDAELRKLVSPRQAIGDIPVDIGGKTAGLLDPIGELTLGKALGDQGDAFSKLDASAQKNLRALAGSDPGMVRKAVVAENDTGFAAARDALVEKLRGEGKSEPEIESVKKGLKELNEAWRNEQAKSLPADHILNIARIIGEMPTEDLRNAIAGSEKLRKMAYDNPDGLRELWQKFKSKERTYSSFERYVKYCDSLVRGNLGEYSAAFVLGDEMALLKAPDAFVFHPGTDLVAVNFKTGEVWIIDNKAFNADELYAVGALTRNFPKNLLDDALEFQRIAGETRVPPEIAEAIGRISKANAQIQVEMGGLPKSELQKPARQKRIAEILDSFQVKRVVTNAGGELQGLAPHLSKLKIEFEDLNK